MTAFEKEQEVPLPVNVLTGFLGSGKTTLLRYLLAHPATGETAVIVNEFGEIGLDHRLVEKVDEDLVLLNSGCLCCTLRSDLGRTLGRLMRERSAGRVPDFGRVVIETTGLADPAPILHSLMGDPAVLHEFRLDSIVATVDGVLGVATLDRHEEAVKQAAVADRLLLTKADLVEPPELADLRERLRALNPSAPISTVIQGEIEPALLLGAGLFDPAKKTADVRGWLNREAYEASRKPNHHHDHKSGRHDVNRHDDHIRAFSLTYDRPLNWDRLNAWLETLIGLYGADILRLKGILMIEDIDGPVVIHGVQHLFHPPVRLEAWPPGPKRSELVVITRDLDRKVFEDTLRSFNDGGPYLKGPH